MKRRPGYIEIRWPDGTVDRRPIDPDQPAIPNAGWVDESGAVVDWAERPPSTAAELEWLKAQIGLDDQAAQAQLEGARSRSRRTRQADADQIRAWLWPLLFEVNQELQARGKKQRGRASLLRLARKRAKEAHRDSVTDSRIRDWIAAGRLKKPV